MRNILLLLIVLNFAACTQSGFSRYDYTNNAPTATGASPGFAGNEIDSAIQGVQQQYNQAGQAISVNEAERVYLQRFATDLQKRRNGLCQGELGQPTCR